MGNWGDGTKIAKRGLWHAWRVVGQNFLHSGYLRSLTFALSSHGDFIRMKDQFPFLRKSVIIQPLSKSHTNSERNLRPWKCVEIEVHRDRDR